jgi:amino-acid N-acetyltransferase
VHQVQSATRADLMAIRALLRSAELPTDVMQLVLLTQTAQSFFERLGYGVIDRALSPEAVRTSAEFRSLCPASAVCMTKTLELSAKVPNE